MHHDHTPLPRWAVRFLRLICPPHLVEEIEGDLIQRLHHDQKKFSVRKSKQRLIWNTLRFFRPGILFRNTITLSPTTMYMLTNYFKIAVRVMLRNKSFSLINISGLALGITGALLLFLWIQKEFSFDQFHQDTDRLYKAWSRDTFDGNLTCWDNTPRILAPTLAEGYASVESAVSYADYGTSFLFTTDKHKIIKNGGIFTDPGFLSMFSFPLKKGDRAKALNDPTSIVITESFARQLFGDKEAFNETITVWEGGNGFPFTITGILYDLPANTDFHFNYLIPFHVLEALQGKDTDWSNHSVSTYVKLRPGVDIETCNQQIQSIISEQTGGKHTAEIFLYPVTQMHLYSSFENGVPSGGRIEIIRMLSILGISLVVIACINFVNLSTARAQKRSKEIGVRKVTGASRASLQLQFLCESILMTILAGVFSLGATYVLLPSFSQLIAQPVSLNLQYPGFWLIFAAALTCIGVLAGSYPAIYLSSFQPVKILKGAIITSFGRNVFRKVLVVLQFGMAIMMIVSTVVVRKQIIFSQNRETGYSKDNLVYQSLSGDLINNYTAYKHDLLQSGIAVSVTKTSSPITENYSNTPALSWSGKDPEQEVVVNRYFADEHLTHTMGLQLVMGRDLDLDKYPGDSSAALINEAALRLMRFTNPIGEIITDGNKEWRIVGVIKDFVISSPFQKISPMIVEGANGFFETVHIKLNDSKPMKENLSQLETIYSKYNPNYPFDYHFVDDAYQRKFAGIQKTLTITTLFSAVIIFISCLGLLGLSTYMIEARIKEIGVRKVLGGSVLNIIRLLSMSSLKPIFIAILLFSPLAWLAMNWWLQSYEYRISLTLGIMLWSALTLIAIALATISIQTFRAASVNPVKSLRSE